MNTTGDTMNKIGAPLLALSLVALSACISEANASPAAHASLEVAANVATYNTAGDAVFNSLDMQAADAGVVTTIVDGGSSTQVYTAVKGTGMAAGLADGSGCITASATTGAFTIALPCGVGDVVLEACFNDIVGGAAGQTTRGAWHRTRSGTTSAVSPVVRKIENAPKADAGNVAAASRGSVGCVEVLTTSVLADTYDFRFISGVAGETVTTRAGTLSIRKIQSR